MAQKRFRPIASKRVSPATRRGVYLAVGVLLIVVAVGAAAQMLWALPSPALPDAAATASIASPAANVAGAGNAAAASSSEPTLYVYGHQLRPLVEETGGVRTLNIYGPGGQIIAQVVQDAQGGQDVRHLLADHLGSTQAVLDADGNAVAHYEYGPYGETTAAGTAAAEVRYRYTGHPYDEAQGVYATPARGYDPTLGRFLSADPQRQDASPYVYAGNNPVGYLDLTGGGRVPYVVRSGFRDSRNSQGGARSIADALGMGSDKLLRDATEFFGKPGVEPSNYKRSILLNILTLSSGENGRTDFIYNDKLYWIIGDEDVVIVPSDIAGKIRAAKGIQTDFANDIVLFDVSLGGDRHRSIAMALFDSALEFHVVSATADNYQIQGYKFFVGRLTVGGRQYDLESAEQVTALRKYVARAPERSRANYSSIESWLYTTPSGATAQPTLGTLPPGQTLGESSDAGPSGITGQGLHQSYGTSVDSPSVPPVTGVDQWQAGQTQASEFTSDFLSIIDSLPDLPQ